MKCFQPQLEIILRKLFVLPLNQVYRYWMYTNIHAYTHNSNIVLWAKEATRNLGEKGVMFGSHAGMQLLSKDILANKLHVHPTENPGAQSNI